MTRVLVVDDEGPIRHALDVNLRARGYDVDLAATGEAALDLAARHHPDAVILDLGLPGIDGLDVVRGLRGWARMPIIILSARDAEAARVEALDAGADDYVTKPFGMAELLARLRAALRRSTPAPDAPTVTTGHFTIDFRAKSVTGNDGARIRLTPIEWRLLEVLATNPGKLVTARHLLVEVWGPTFADKRNYLRVHLAHLRRKLEPTPSRPRYLMTEPGMGYRFHPDTPGDA